MKRHLLKVEKREVTGKKVKQLRKKGILPANIYGKDVKSTAVQVALKDFEAIYKETGETGLLDLELNNEKKPVLIHNVHFDYLKQVPLHADFYQVNLKEKVKTMVPITLINEPKAVTDKLGLSMQTLNELEVEALPADLPEKIEVDVANLAAVGDQITVENLKKPSGVEILTDPTQVIVKISELVSKEAEEEAAREAAAAEAAKAESTAEEGAQTKEAEGEIKEETAKEETKPTEEKK